MGASSPMNTAAVGLELPCRQALPANQLLHLLLNRCVVHAAPRRSGRLLPPRPLAKALRALLNACDREAKARAKALARTDAVRAAVCEASHHAWLERERRQHLTPHHLRVPLTDRFACWHLPACAWRYLVAQLAKPLAEWPPDRVLTLLARVPITPCLRLGEPWELAAYLHAPSRYATGPWVQVPAERVQAWIEGWEVVVRVE